MYIYLVSADLFQSSSVLDYSCNPQCLPIQHPQSLPILAHLEASKHPSIQASLTAGIPHSIILKGSQIRPAGDFSPRTSCPSPLALKLVPPPARGSQMAHLTGNRHPSIQASEHPGIHSACTGVPNGSFDRQQAPQQPGIRAPRHPGIHASGPEVGGRGGSL